MSGRLTMLWCALLVGLAATAARADELVFLSTQLRPLEEAQKARTQILKGAPMPVSYLPEEPPQLPIHLQADEQGARTISLVGALHGELAPLAASFQPLDQQAGLLAQRGVPEQIARLAHLGTDHLMYMPWMQATYIMAANKKALPYLPQGATLETLTYAQLAQWAENAEKATGQRVLGFPAGPTGLMARFFQGYLLPSYTGGVVVSFRSPEAVTMWEAFKALWKHANPNSTNYNFMQEPLLSGDVLIAWDHVARLQNAFRNKPDDFLAFPAPAGPKGRGFMPVLVGVAVPKTAPDAAGASKLIDYLLQPETQIATLRASFFFPVVKVALPTDLEVGLKLEAQAVQQQQTAPDALPTLLPVGLGSHNGEFDKIFVDTFQRIVLRDQPVQDVLAREAEDMQRVLNAAQAPCWSPDPPSQGACQVK
ncbi:MAG TPA: ABC transporter substrate-binding protein [Acetobacteraceae bacterium]